LKCVDEIRHLKQIELAIYDLEIRHPRIDWEGLNNAKAEYVIEWGLLKNEKRDWRRRLQYEHGISIKLLDEICSRVHREREESISRQTQSFAETDGAIERTEPLESRSATPGELGLHTIPNLPQSPTKNKFLRKGDVWTISHKDEVIQLQHIVGLEYVAKLLQRPGQSMSAILILASSSAKRPRLRPEDEDRDSASMENTQRRGSNGKDVRDVVDPQTVRECENEARRLGTEIAEARRCGAQWVVENKTVELERITDYLKSNTGLRGRSRKFSDEQEKARVTVTNGIRRALTKIAESAPDTAKYLEMNLKTGTSMSYLDALTSWSC
jgi:hypothetical protein